MTERSVWIQTIGPEPAGATPIAEEDLDGLIPSFVATRADLNRVEYENILAAMPWAFTEARKRGALGVLDIKFVFDLHRRMFGDVWEWAGSQRRRETNLGVAPHQILEALKASLDDARYWHEHEIFDLDRRAALIHYRLVFVHPFPNGNGRCTRLIADLYRVSVGAEPFSWSRDRLDIEGSARNDYIRALELVREDDGDALVAFARR